MKRSLFVLFLVTALAGCVSRQGIIDKGDYKVDVRHTAQAAYPRVKILVVHYTAEDFHGALNILTNKEVSAHYLIPAPPPLATGKPVIWQLVPEDKLAWHAGVSFWRGATRINDTSIGIELENPGWTTIDKEKRFAPFSASQIAVFEALAHHIIQRYGIEPQNVVAHGDIAPQRKVDPGPRFPWQLLAKQGIGAWPDPARVAFYLKGQAPYAPVESSNFLDLLSRYGYQVVQGMSDTEKQRVIRVFQMHFRPANYSGIADAESQAIVEALLEKYGQH